MSDFAHTAISEIPETCESRNLGEFSAALLLPAWQGGGAYKSHDMADPKTSSKRINPIHDLIF